MDYPIKPVRGNWLKLAQPLEKIVWLNSQHTIEDYVPAEGDNLKVALVGAYDHYEMEKVQIELNPDNNKRNLLTYENNGTLPLGLYDIEISVTLADGKRLHSCQPKRVKVVKTNSEASIPDSVEFGIDTFELDGAVFMYVPNGEGGGGDMSNYYTKDEADELFMPANTPIPSEVTESTVSEWGFTKNTGTYSKPQGGIPKTDLASDVQTSLGKADNAIQKAAQGTTGLLKPDGTVDNSTYLTQHQDISGKVNTSDLSNVAFSGDYDDLENKPTIPSSSGDVNVIEEVQVNGVALNPDSNKAVNVQVPTNNNQLANGAGYITSADIAGKEDKVAIITPELDNNNAFNATVGNYYKVTGNASAIDITLVTPSDTSHLSSCIFLIDNSNGVGASFHTQNLPFYQAANFAIATGKIYEVNALFNGTAWYLTQVEMEVQS